jgi:hypothetical protein
MSRCITGAGLASLVLFVLGCGTTRMTDTQRTATEQLLISNAVDRAVEQIDFRPLAGKPVYFDSQYLDGTVDKGYLVSSLRQSLLAHGCLLCEDRTKATYVVEVRSGAVGTDRHSLLVGVPQMTVPTFLPGQPSQIPEIPVAKKTDEQGVAKIALFAYNRVTGRRAWQSGMVEAGSDAKDLWVAGLGPFRKGSIVQGTELAGEDLALPHLGDREGGDHHAAANLVPLNYAVSWPEPPPAKSGLPPIVDMLVLATMGDRIKVMNSDNGRGVNSSPKAAAADSAGASKNASAATGVPGAPAPGNAGGHAETEPAKVSMSAFHFKPDE